MGEVISLNGEFPEREVFNEVDISKVLDGAKEFDLQRVLIIGVTQQGKLYGASSQPELPLMLWDLKLMEQTLLEIGLEVNDE